MPRPRIYDEPPVNTQIRFPRKLHARLREEAERRGISVNALVLHAVTDFLSRKH